MGIATIALILIPAFIWYWHPKIQVRLYEKGVVHQGLFKRTELAWEDLLFVRYRAVRQRFHGVNVGTNYYVTLVGRKMETIKLTNNLQGGVKLINYVLNRILEAQIPKFTTLINQGHEIPFGKIFLGSGGLRVKARVARWQDIAGISLASGQVKVRLKNKWFSFYRKQFSSMPNGHAFIHLCQQRLGVK